MFDDSYYAALDKLPPVRYVVSLSSGASSAVAADRAIRRYGKAAVDLVFADTTWEDEDNYRFLDDIDFGCSVECGAGDPGVLVA